MQQPMPYYSPGYPPNSPYPTSGPPSNQNNITTSTPILSSAIPTLSDTHHTAGVVTGIKRKQVKNACTNCQKACKKCDDARPCPRCVKYGIIDTCVNSVRKERQKGVKRGPYKRKDKSIDNNKSVKVEEVNQINYNPAANIRTQPPPANNNPFAYPSQLTQYNQPQNEYYAYTTTYSKDQIIPHPFVMNGGYPYPVMTEPTSTSTSSPSTTTTPSVMAATNSSSHPHYAQLHFGRMDFPPFNHSQANLLPGLPTVVYTPTTTPTTTSSNIIASGPIMNNNHSHPNTTTTATATTATSTTTSVSTVTNNSSHGDTPALVTMDESIAKQPMTPVPSTSNSSSTSSPSNSHEDDDHKLTRLSQLCSAALGDTTKPTNTPIQSADKEN